MKIFRKPHPFIFNWNSLLVPCAITFLVVVLFRPFGFAQFGIGELLLWALFFGNVAAGCVFVVVRLLQAFFPRAMEAGKWTVGKEVLLVFSVVFTISCVVFLLFLLLHPQATVGQLFGTVFVQTLLISVFPVLTLVLYEQYHHQKIKRQEAQALNEQLLQKQAKTNVDAGAALPPKITLYAENQKLALQLAPAQLLFARSEGNYVELFYRQNQKTERGLVRNSLKAVADQLPTDLFFRCHKSYLINLHHLQKVEGNARNLEITLENVGDKIPVSRSKSEALMQAIQQMGK